MHEAAGNEQGYFGCTVCTYETARFDADAL